jgi:membrane-associated phospholipid phosphatase
MEMSDNKIVCAVARFFSSVMSPLLMPTYGILIALWASVLCYQPVGTRLTVLIVVFGITCMLPMIVIAGMHNLKFIEDKRLIKKEERWLPYLFTIVCYSAAGFYLNHVHAPMWLTIFIIGGVASCVVSFVINFWWKISAHTAGVGGLLAFMVRLYVDGLGAFNLLWLICIMIIVCGFVGSSRIALGRHTFLQTVGGFVNGFVCIYVVSGLV